MNKFRNLIGKLKIEGVVIFEELTICKLNREKSI